jgi:hypothetical protein
MTAGLLRWRFFRDEAGGGGESQFLQTMIRGTGNALAGPSVIARRGCAQPKPPTTQGHPRDDKQEQEW